MNTKVSEFVHSRIFITILAVISMILVVITGTYAWFTWSSTENTSLTMTIGKLADVVFTSGNDITTGLTPVFNYYDGESTTFSVVNKDTTGATASYTVKLNITTIPTALRRTDVKYALTKNGTLVANDNLSTAVDGSSIDVYTSTLDSGTTEYVFYLYIDGNEENPTTMKNQNLVGELTVIESTTS